MKATSRALHNKSRWSTFFQLQVKQRELQVKINLRIWRQRNSKDQAASSSTPWTVFPVICPSLRC